MDASIALARLEIELTRLLEVYEEQALVPVDDLSGPLDWDLGVRMMFRDREQPRALGAVEALSAVIDLLHELRDEEEVAWDGFARRGEDRELLDPEG